MAPARLAAVLDDREAALPFQRAAVSIVLTNPNMDDNPIVYVNDGFQRVTGYAASAVIGRNCRFLQGEKTKKSSVDRLRSAIAAGEEVAVDILNYRADGSEFWNRLVISPVNGRDGQLQYFLGVQKDLGDSRPDDAADTATQALGVLSERVAHDLSMIVRGIGTAAADGSDVDDFRTIARRMEALEFVYEEMELSPALPPDQRVDLAPLVSRLVHAIAHREGRAGLRCQVAVEPCAVSVDTATRTGLLVAEIVDNAFVHAFDRIPEGMVDVRLSRLSAGGFRLMISDDGLGLPPERFANAQSTGRLLINALVEGMDGILEHPRSVAGTTFLIEVPLDLELDDDTGGRS